MALSRPGGWAGELERWLALGSRCSAVAGERPPLGRTLVAVAGQPLDVGRDRRMAGRLRHGLGSAGRQASAALGHEDDAPSRSADGDGEDHEGEQFQAGHGFSHPRTLRAARCNTTEAPIQRKAPRTTASGGCREVPKS